MSPDQLGDLLRSIGADHVKTFHNRVTSSCPLATWTHPSGRDNKPSFVAFPAGLAHDGKDRPIYSCLSCGSKGSVWSLLLFLLSKGRDTWPWIEVLGGEGTVERAKKRSLSDGLPKGHLVARTRPAVRKEAKKLTPSPNTAPLGSGDDRPWYDYKAVQLADDLEEVPWDDYERYIGSVPRYALDRGLTLDTCRVWQLGNDKGVAAPTWNASPQMPRWVTSRRLLFPIRDHRGRLVAISGRLYAKACFACDGPWARSCERCGAREDEHWEEDGDLLCDGGDTFAPLAATCVRCGKPQPPKYLHRRGFKRNLLLFGEHRIERDETDGRVYVVEGHLDMIRLWQLGYRPVVAVLGNHPGPTQVEKLVKLAGRIVVVPDGNEPGDIMGRKIESMIAGRIQVDIAKMPRGRDPGDLSDDALRKLLRKPPRKRLTDAKYGGQNR